MTQENIHGTQDTSSANSPELLLEQYKLYVEMTDRVSARRAETNKFYISLLTALLILLSIVMEKQLFPRLQNVILLAIGMLGLALCFVWVINLRAYRQLNSGKFKVIHEMERQLPFPCYDREWVLLAKGADSKKYVRLSRIEQVVPYLLAVPYLFLLVYAIIQWFS